MVEKVDLGYSSRQSNQNIEYLERRFEEIQDDQGIFGKFWNGVKETVNIGSTEKKCDNMLDAYNEGKISFEEALEYINNFEQKQDNMTELFKNILTGVGSIAVATTIAGGPITWTLAAAAGLPSGALIKTGLGIGDRLTNETKGDALDTKELIKDSVSGAITGMTSAVTSGVGKGISTGSFGTTVKNGVLCSAECGAISGATSYLTDTALDEDKQFKFGELTSSTLTSSLVSGVVGGTVGAGLFGQATLKGTVNQIIPKSTTQTIIADSSTSSLRKVLNRNLKDAATSAA